MSEQRRTIKITHLHETIEKLRVRNHGTDYAHHFLGMCSLNLVNALLVPRQIISDLLCHSERKHADHRRARVEERMVLIHLF